MKTEGHSHLALRHRGTSSQILRKMSQHGEEGLPRHMLTVDPIASDPWLVLIFSQTPRTDDIKPKHNSEKANSVGNPSSRGSKPQCLLIWFGSGMTLTVDDLEKQIDTRLLKNLEGRGDWGRMDTLYIWLLCWHKLLTGYTHKVSKITTFRKYYQAIVMIKLKH